MDLSFLKSMSAEEITTARTVLLKGVRISFCFIGYQSKKGKNGVQILIPKNSPELRDAYKASMCALADEFGTKENLKAFSNVIRNGDADSAINGQPRDGDEYRGHYFFNAGIYYKDEEELTPPVAFSDIRHNGELVPLSKQEIEDKLFWGAPANVVVRFYATKPTAKKPEITKGVAASLVAVIPDASRTLERIGGDYTPDIKGMFGDLLRDSTPEDVLGDVGGTRTSGQKSDKKDHFDADSYDSKDNFDDDIPF